jgi:hypothetical protein
VNSIDWNGLCQAYVNRLSTRLGTGPAAPFELPSTALARLTHPTDADVAWLVDALAGAASRYDVFEQSTALAEVFFVPLLDAAIDEVDPSYNRYFVEPCVNTFGPRRVNEYLLGVVESGTDFRKAGAVNAMYWARAALAFLPGAPSFRIEHATPESRALYESLRDVRERQRCLFLETFVANPATDVRRSIIPSLDLDPDAYPEGHRSLVAKAIDIARRHDDEYIRNRVEVQLGDCSRGLSPLPHRVKGAPSA